MPAGKAGEEAVRRLRLAVFAMLPSASAATRAFCERPLPYLAEQGIDARVFRPSGDRAYQLLGCRSGPLRVPLAAVYWYLLVAPRRLVQLLRALRYDVIFVQRSMLRHRSPPALEGLLWLLAGKLVSRRIVYHCDDALYTISPTWYRMRFRLADLVLTGNREIARYASEVSGNVRALDGAVDVQRYPVRSHVPRRPVVIGWVGHSPHLDLPPITSALVEVCRRRDVIVEIVSERRYVVPELGAACRWRRWRPELEFSLFFGFDIGIGPLSDSEYHRAREAYKIKEYMAAGLPVVCSPVGHNGLVVQHSVTGYLARNHREWVDYLVRLVDDERLRTRLGAAGRRLAQERYDVPRLAGRLARLVWTLGAADGSTAPTERPIRLLGARRSHERPRGAIRR